MCSLEVPYSSTVKFLLLTTRTENPMFECFLQEYLAKAVLLRRHPADIVAILELSGKGIICINDDF